MSNVLTSPWHATDYPWMPALCIPLIVIDLPLSLIGDTLTLPYTIAIEVNSAVIRSINDYYFPPDRAKVTQTPEQLAPVITPSPDLPDPVPPMLPGSPPLGEPAPRR